MFVVKQATYYSTAPFSNLFVLQVSENSDET